MFEHVHIITLTDYDMRETYMLYPLLQSWRAQGIEVTVGPAKTLEADIGILHVNSTRVSPDILPNNPQRHPIINGRMLDISKRRISSHILSIDSQYNGPVIIKTNANYFGKRDFQRLPAWSLRRLRQKLTRHLPWQHARELPRNNYPVLDNISDVPAWVWQRDELVVERFQPEMENGEYILRMWMFLGDRSYGAKLYSNEAIVKVKNMNRYEYLDSVPEALQSVRRDLSIDYGKFDYVMNNGEPVLLDVNTTPTISATAKPGTRLLSLAEGLYCFGHNP